MLFLSDIPDFDIFYFFFMFTIENRSPSEAQNFFPLEFH